MECSGPAPSQATGSSVAWGRSRRGELGDMSPPGVPIWLHDLRKVPSSFLASVSSSAQWESDFGLTQECGRMKGGHEGESHECKRLFSGSGEERKRRLPVHLPGPQRHKGSGGRSQGPPRQAHSHLLDWRAPQQLGGGRSGRGWISQRPEELGC